MKCLCALLIFGLAASVATESFAASKPDRRSKMTAAQKQELRKKGREWCRKNHAKGNAEILDIQIMSDGGIRCWYRG
jgi:hypothetical protein